MLIWYKVYFFFISYFLSYFYMNYFIQFQLNINLLNMFQCITRSIVNYLVHINGSCEVRDNASSMGRSVKQSLCRSTTWLAIVILAAGWKVLQNIPGRCCISLYKVIGVLLIEYIRESIFFIFLFFFLLHQNGILIVYVNYYV